jgi:hypothetical protein
MKTGFFNMDVIRQVTETAQLEMAKNLAILAIDSQPNATPANINKAKTVINKANSVEMLAISMSNFMLAHPSENLAVIK